MSPSRPDVAHSRRRLERQSASSAIDQREWEERSGRILDLVERLGRILDLSDQS